MKPYDYEVWKQLMKKVDSRGCHTLTSEPTYKGTAVLAKPMAWCLAIDPNLRSENDLKDVRKHLLSFPLSKYTQSLNDEQMFNFSKSAKGLFIPSNQLLAPQGSVLNRFFVVIEGYLVGQQFQQKNKILSKIFVPGDIIGTQCLIYSQGLNWSLQSGKEGCFMMFLERDDFNRILKFHEAAKIETNLNVLKQVDLFTGMKDEQLIQLIFSGNIVTVNPNKFFYKEKSITEGFFVILQGQMKKYLKPQDPNDKGKEIKESDYFGYYELVKKEPFRVQSIETIGKVPVKLIYWNNDLFTKFFPIKGKTYQMLTYLIQQEEKLFLQEIQKQNKIILSITREKNTLDSSTKIKLPSPNQINLLIDGFVPKTLSDFKNSKEIERIEIQKEQNIQKNQKNLCEQSSPYIEMKSRCLETQTEEFKVNNIIPEPEIQEQTIDCPLESLSIKNQNQKEKIKETEETVTDNAPNPSEQNETNQYEIDTQVNDNTDTTTADFQSQYQMKFLQEQQQRFQSYSPLQKRQKSQLENKQFRRIVKTTRLPTPSNEDGWNLIKSPFKTTNIVFKMSSKENDKKAVSLHEPRNHLTTEGDEDTENNKHTELNDTNFKGIDMSFHDGSMKPVFQNMYSGLQQQKKASDLSYKNTFSSSQNMAQTQQKFIDRSSSLEAQQSIERNVKSSRTFRTLRKRQYSLDNQLQPAICSVGIIEFQENQSPKNSSQNANLAYYNQVVQTNNNNFLSSHSNSHGDLLSKGYQFSSQCQTSDTEPLKKQNSNISTNCCHHNKIMGNFQCKKQSSQQKQPSKLSFGEFCFLPNVDFFKMNPLETNTSKKLSQAEQAPKQRTPCLENLRFEKKPPQQSSSIKRAIANYFSVPNPLLSAKMLENNIKLQQGLFGQNKSQENLESQNFIHSHFEKGGIVGGGDNLSLERQTYNIYSISKEGGNKFESTGKKWFKNSIHLNKQQV